MLYELVTGRHPFMAASQLGTLHALMWETPEPPSLRQSRAAARARSADPRDRCRRTRGCGRAPARCCIGSASRTIRSIADGALGGHGVARAARAQPRASSAAITRWTRCCTSSSAPSAATGAWSSLSAEAGVGKTTLVDAFVRLLEERGEAVRVGRGRCSERLAGSEAYLPVLEVLDSLQRSEQHGSLSRLIRALAPSWYAQIMPPSANDSSAARLAAETAVGSQERLKREIAALLEEARRACSPVVLCFDDVHWADPSTTDLHRLSGPTDRHDMRLLIIATCRPSELAQARHPFLPLKLDLVARGACREIAPGLLDEAAVGRYLALQFPEHAFPAGFAAADSRSAPRAIRCSWPICCAICAGVRSSGSRTARGSMAEDLPRSSGRCPESVRSLVQRKMDALDDADRRLLGAASVQGSGLRFGGPCRLSCNCDEEDVEDRARAARARACAGAASSRSTKPATAS